MTFQFIFSSFIQNFHCASFCIACGTGIVIYWILYKTPKINFKNKVVVIVGASSGLGEACASAFYKCGCKLVLCARRLDELERVKNEILRQHSKSAHHDPIIVQLDVANFKLIPDVVNKILSSNDGKVDILINNAGISFRGLCSETSLETDQKIMNVNYFGQVAVTKAFLQSMTNNKNGHIVYISSLQGKLGIPFRGAYAASKHAIQGFADCLRSEVANDNIKVSVISPAYIRTNLSLNALNPDGSKYGVLDETTKSGMTPESAAQQVVNTVVYQKNEVLLAGLSYRLFVYFRNIFPDVYFYFTAKRANKALTISK